jgi:hypothetical protein
MLVTSTSLSVSLSLSLADVQCHTHNAIAIAIATVNYSTPYHLLCDGSMAYVCDVALCQVTESESIHLPFTTTSFSSLPSRYHHLPSLCTMPSRCSTSVAMMALIGIAVVVCLLGMLFRLTKTTVQPANPNTKYSHTWAHGHMDSGCT